MINYLTTFPNLRINVAEPVDAFVRYINIHYGEFFVSFKRLIGIFVGALNSGLDAIPWWILILAVAYGGGRLMNSYRKGAFFGGLLFFIGLLGYWQMMCETLSIVLAAVFFSLLIGLPIGVLLASIKRADPLIRPFLDAMQTMPTFVYMIPAVMLLGPGKVPAVLATVVYAVVPVIRLTQSWNQASRSRSSRSVSFIWGLTLPDPRQGADPSGPAYDHDGYQSDHDDGGCYGRYKFHDRCQRPWYGSPHRHQPYGIRSWSVGGTQYRHHCDPA